MQITSIKVRRVFDEGAMRAIVSVTLDDVLAIHDIKVICARGKHFIVMPSRKMPDNTFRDIAHPINAEFRAELETAILAEYTKEAQRIHNEASEREWAGDSDVALNDGESIVGADVISSGEAHSAEEMEAASELAAVTEAETSPESAAAENAPEEESAPPHKRRSFFGLGF